MTLNLAKINSTTIRFTKPNHSNLKILFYKILVIFYDNYQQ